MKDFEKLYKEAEMVAFLAHKNHTYDIFPYEKHLLDVVDVLKRFGFAGDFILAGYLHDTIEDGNLTYNKLKKAFGLNVAEMVLAVTDPSDVRSRKEKKSRVYEKINAYPNALIIKLADRIANVEHGIRMGNDEKFEMYLEGQEEFKAALKKPGHVDNMWEYLDGLFSSAKKVA